MDVGVGNGGRSVIVGSEVEVLLACRSVAGNAIDHGAFSLSIQYKPTNEDDDASAGEFSPRGQRNGRSSYATTLVTHPHATQAHNRPHDFLSKFFVGHFVLREQSLPHLWPFF